MNFYELLILAKSGDDLANEKILAMYQPLLTKESVIDVYGMKICIKSFASSFSFASVNSVCDLFHLRGAPFGALFSV